MLISGLVCSFAQVARAQGESAEVRAQALFDEASELFRAGQYPAACAKFAESQRLDAKGGTLLNLAICSEKAGKTATAFTQFSQALAQARRDERPERVQFAEERLAALRGELSFLTVNVPVNARVRGLRIDVDGAQLNELIWGEKIPVDPGEHLVMASAPGYEQISQRVVVAGRADQRTWSLPPLRRTVLPISERAAPEVSGDQVRRGWGLFVGGLGVAGTAAGAAFGVSALSGRERAEELCRDNRCDEGRTTNNTAETHAWIANAAFGLGIVGLSVGAYLYIAPGPAQNAPSRAKASANVAVKTRPGGLTVEGSF